MQTEADIVAVAGAADRMCPRLIEARDDIGASIKLNVDDADVVLRGPVDRVLQREFAADVDADSLGRDSGHVFSPDALFEGSLHRWGVVRKRCPVLRLVGWMWPVASDVRPSGSCGGPSPRQTM